MDISDRLRQARLDAGYASAAEAARRLGMAYPTYAAHENGTRQPKKEEIERYARHFRKSFMWLLTGKSDSRLNSVPVLVYVGAGAEVHAIADYENGGAVEYVDSPPWGDTNCVAARIKGDSMYPLQDGWLIFWTRNQEGVPDGCLHKLCVVQVKNGPTLVKILRPGSRHGVFNLESWNAPLKIDAVIEWAAVVSDIRPT
jgi:transcriptional regulator with XRE-family HTH domain